MIVPQSFWDKVMPEPNSGCWLWTAALAGKRDADKAYPAYWDSETKRQHRGHKYIYERAVGPVPDGMVIDHLCRVRCCVNPDHLEVVTPRENLMRGETLAALNVSKTQCPKGHPLAGDNLLRNKAGHRRCRQCYRDHEARYRAKRKTT